MARGDGPARMILGGHSFINQLGNDEPADIGRQAEVVSACLDAGICCIDTTYQPERLALGECLSRLGRHDEARVLVWNFFPAPDNPLPGPQPWQEQHLEQIRAELQRQQIDRLVIHPLADAAADRAQIACARQWLATSQIGALGIWSPDDAVLDDPAAPFSFAVGRNNIECPDQGSFARMAARGWRVVGTSPFNRGWLIDALIDQGIDRALVADRLLRWAAYAPHVDKVVVAIRRPEWVALNCASLERGPLGPGEIAELEGWVAQLG